MIYNTIKFYLLVSFAYIIKVPMAYMNFYAEDGIIFYQEARDLPFPIDLLKPATGYLILISRIIGRLITLFPIEILPVVNFIIVCIAIAFICSVTWININEIISNFYLRLICCSSIIFLPILNFELMASASVLHFILLFPFTLILINYRNKKSINKIDIFILSLTLLSDPLSVMFIIILFKRENFKNWKLIFAKNKILYMIIICCIFLQSFAALSSLVTGGRKISHAGSILKTVYLYLDRVVGNAILPNWGFINSNDYVSGLLNSKIIIRGGFTLFLIALLLILFVIT